MNSSGGKLRAPTYLEAAAAAKLRGLPVPASWPAIESAARELAVRASVADFAARAQSRDLVAAARALDNIAQGAPEGGALARERGLWAAATYAAGGNFPSANVVIARTFPRIGAQDAATATLLCALAPASRFKLRAQTPLASALDALLAGQSSGVLAAFDAVEHAATNGANVGTIGGKSAANVGAVGANAASMIHGGAVAGNAHIADAANVAAYAPELWQLARAGLHSVAGSATNLALADAPLPEGFAHQLGAHIPTLLPPQLDAIRSGLLSGDNALAALPPGTGKTLLGELFLASSLADGKGLAVFLVPYVSLGRGVVAALRAHCPSDIPVHRWMGGHGDGGEQCRADERAEIAVVTPERFDALLRARPELWAQLRGVVIDEAHTLGDGARGARVEGLIARLRAHQAEGGDLRLMLLSAALDERAKLEEWAGVRRVFASSWTPTARRLAFWRDDGRLEWHAELAGGRSKSLGEIGLPWPQPIASGGDGWARTRKLEPRAWENVAHLARRLHDERGGAILCLCSTRRATREVARALGEMWDEPASVNGAPIGLGGAAARAVESIEARHRTLLPLARLIERGVAWHNSSLPPEVRDALEEAIASGQISAVAATTTLAEGVDLPFAQTIVADWLKWDDGGQRPLSSALFRNIAGRCGRAGAFTEGDTLVFDNPLGPAQFTAPAVRRALQRSQFVGAVLREPRSALGRAGDEAAEFGTAQAPAKNLAKPTDIAHSVAGATANLAGEAAAEWGGATKLAGTPATDAGNAAKLASEAVTVAGAAHNLAGVFATERGEAVNLAGASATEGNPAHSVGRILPLESSRVHSVAKPLPLESSEAHSAGKTLPAVGEVAPTSPPATVDEHIGGARDGALAALESQLLALMREQPHFGTRELARAFYVAHFDAGFEARVAAICASFARDGLLERDGTLSARGAAIARTDWSPASALRLLGVLESLPAQRFESAADMARLNAYLWRALGAAPEAGGEIERFFRARSRLVARPEHLEQLGKGWLAGVAPEAIFASLPRAQNLAGLGAWLGREDAPAGASSQVPEWGGEFDRWLDFQRAGLESWTPWLWRTAALLAPLAGARMGRIKWSLWASRWELGVDSVWAVRALSLGAPGTRTTCALVGRHWPFRSSQPALDALALAPLREESGRERAGNAMDAALREAGGAYCFAGRNVLALRDWVWARAGLTK